MVTARHCTLTYNNVILDESQIMVKVGYTKRDASDAMVQTYHVVQVIRHLNYKKGQNDVALLEIAEKFTFTEPNVQPICVWNGESNFEKIVHGVGYFVGLFNGQVEDLQEITIPIVSYESCNAHYSRYKNFILDSSKFCGGYLNGTMTSDGDSGNGLYLKVGKTWFLRGILSVGILGGYDLFMDVAHYRQWIEKHIPDFRRIFPVVNETNQCGFRRLLSIHNETVPIGWPWHGAMFHRSWNGELMYQCGVTILTEFYVVSAAHCTLDGYFYKLPAKRIFIKVGLSKLNASEHVQLHQVEQVMRHEFYYRNHHEDDIVLLKLKSKIVFEDPYVHPICLWSGEMWLNRVVNQTGHIAGWGYNERGEISNELQEASMPIVSRRTCLDSDPEHFRLLYRDPKTFCAGYKNGTNAGAGDSGGGLYLKIGEQWFLRGIINNIKRFNSTTNDLQSYLLLLDVGFYQYWIRENIPSDQFPPK